MTATRHGFFSRGFMLCDRCALNGVCERLSPGATCAVEEESLSQLVGDLMREYGLDGVADRVLAERAAMILIKIARVEAYEAAAGAKDSTVVLGHYVERLDKLLLRILDALAVTRGRRKALEGGEALMVSLTDLLQSLKKGSRRRAAPRRVRGEGVTFEFRARNLYAEILRDWLRGLGELRGGEKVG